MPSLYNSLLERMEGRQYGHYFSTWCPFDRHEKPALLVFQDGKARCLSCVKTWTHQQVDRKLGSHFIQTQRLSTVSQVLPRWRRWEEKYGDLECIAQAAHKTLKGSTAYQTYFKRRKIHDFIPEGLLGYLDGWITFPVMDTSRNIKDIVVRSLSQHSDIRYVVHPGMGTNRPIYVPSWNLLNESETVYVVYGIVDAISLHLAGLPSLTGVTGKSLNAELLKPLGKKFIIIPDQDEEREAHRLANQLGWRARVKQISWPDGAKDVDDIRRKYGNDQLLHFLGA